MRCINLLVLFFVYIDSGYGQYYLYCHEEIMEESELKHFPIFNSALYTENCRPPKVSYVNFFTQNGINVSSITQLLITAIPLESETLRTNHFEGLYLTRLELDFEYSQYHLPEPMPNFLESLPRLTYLKFSYAVLPSLPQESLIEEAILYNGVSKGPFGGCKKLKTLYLSNWIVNEEDWLLPCDHLTTLTLEDMTGNNALQIVFDANPLKELTVTGCDFVNSHITEEFSSYTGTLTYLELTYNGLKLLPRMYQDNNLEVLKLSHNRFEFSNLFAAIKDDFADIVMSSPRLHTLDISYTELNVCYKHPLFRHSKDRFAIPKKHPKLRKLYLNHTTSSFECIGDGMPALEYLSLTDNSFTSIQDLPVSRVPLHVNLEDTPIKHINMTATDYKILRKRSIASNNKTLTLQGLEELDCDCRNGYLARALQKGLLNAPAATCNVSAFHSESTKLTNVPKYQLECDKFPCEGCVCRRTWSDHSVTADCRGADVTRIPQESSLRTLIAPFNQVKTLRREEIPKTLMRLDLAENLIGHVDEETATEMFSVPQRLFNLSGNPIVCHCENKLFIHALQQHFQQIEDYSKMRCASKQILLLRDVNISNLCVQITALMATLIVGGSLITLGVFVSIVHYRYGRAIRIFLYARGWFAYCIQEDKLDADRPYDAFVSFCQSDFELVAQELIPQLEQFGYKICVHYRDWLPGELIPTQIVRSVEASRRTIIVFSRSFVESSWGLLEFRTAYVRAMKEGVVRIIIVVLDEVVTDDLHKDLQSYLRSNTYVRWDDAWFWDKMRYAMPRRRAQSEDGANRSLDPSLALQVISNASIDTI